MINLRILTFLYAVCFFQINTNAQDCGKYSLSGTINRNDGTVYFTSGFIDSTYHGKCFSQNTFDVINGQFSFEGNISCPVAIRLAWRDSSRNYYSGLIFLDKINQSLSIDADSVKVTPYVRNSVTNNEYLNRFSLLSHWIDSLERLHENKFDSLSEIYGQKTPDSLASQLDAETHYIQAERDSFVLRYATLFPNSYVALWEIIERFMIFGFKPIYDSSYLALSAEIKKSEPALLLQTNLKIAKLTGVGQLFPDIALLALDNEKKHLNKFYKKFTLVDFWFSNCSPCIKQFSRLSKIYSKYVNNGFEIVSVSVDPEKDKLHLKNIIQSYKLPWKQLWDPNGTISQTLYINSFPTNFLLDETGKIVAQNLTPEQLEDWLTESIPVQ